MLGGDRLPPHHGVLLLHLPRARAGSVPLNQAQTQNPCRRSTPPWEAGGKLRHREVAEAKVSCSERTQMSWLQAQIHVQLHKNGTKETPNGCKPPPCFPPHPGRAPGSPTQPS